MELLEKPKRKRVYRAHVYDVGMDDSRRPPVFFVCMCGWQSGWIRNMPVREAKRGIPCPKCNDEEQK
jgi:hypothetical protein